MEEEAWLAVGDRGYTAVPLLLLGVLSMSESIGGVQHTQGVPMTVTDEYLANNAVYARTFEGPLPMPPSKHVAIVACMDARLDVYRILGLGDGEAHVIRNAGGVVTDDAIRSLAISQRLLGTRG